MLKSVTVYSNNCDDQKKQIYFLLRQIIAIQKSDEAMKTETNDKAETTTHFFAVKLQRTLNETLPIDIKYIIKSNIQYINFNVAPISSNLVDYFCP